MTYRVRRSVLSGFGCCSNMNVSQAQTSLHQKRAQQEAFLHQQEAQLQREEAQRQQQQEAQRQREEAERQKQDWHKHGQQRADN